MSGNRKTLTAFERLCGSVHNIAYRIVVSERRMRALEDRMAALDGGDDAGAAEARAARPITNTSCRRR